MRLVPIEANFMVYESMDTSRFMDPKASTERVGFFSVVPKEMPEAGKAVVMHWSQIVRKGPKDPEKKPYSKREIHQAFQAHLFERRRRKNPPPRMSAFERFNLGDPAGNRLPS